MKTLEQKAKAYDEAIKVAKSKIKNDNDHVLYEKDITDIFPELAESDDERIRKEIIAHIKWCEDSGYCAKEEMTRWITFLEKQGEKSFSWHDVSKEPDNKTELKDFPSFDEAQGTPLLMKKDKPNPAWSEEDDQYLLVCKNALAKYQTTDKWDASVIYRWLENKLKTSQDTWKPSERQKEALLWCVVHLGGADKQALGELLEELNKL